MKNGYLTPANEIATTIKIKKQKKDTRQLEDKKIEPEPQRKNHISRHKPMLSKKGKIYKNHMSRLSN